MVRLPSWIRVRVRQNLKDYSFYYFKTVQNMYFVVLYFYKRIFFSLAVTLQIGLG